MAPSITEIEVHEFGYDLADFGTNPNGYNLLYEPGTTTRRTVYGIRVHVDDGHTGEFVGGTTPGFAQLRLIAPHLIEKNPLDRERHWNEHKRALRKYDGMGIGPLDIALWDYAGKRYVAPVHELLGTYRDRLPAYASMSFLSDERGLTTPDAVADFAETCLDRNFPAFKIHTWSGLGAGRDYDREIATVHAVGNRVGDDMDLMLDPVCEYETFGDALRVGRACDEQGYFWYEDPYMDGGRSQHGHRRLRELLETPLLMTELVRGVEPHADFAAAEATDFLRADPEWDGGITGAMKIARVAEGFGLDVEYHLAGPAQRHCMAATRNSNYYELGLLHPESPTPHTESPVYCDGYTDSVESLDSNGTVPVPDGPGLGVTYDWEYIEANATQSLRFD